MGYLVYREKAGRLYGGTLCVERRQVGSMGYLVYRGESRGLREKKGVGEREEESG